jgi:hypothetical protein
MWLARLFNGRRDDSEPAEFPPHPAAIGGAVQVSRPKASVHTTQQTAAAVVKKGTGFDPYNSGAFRKTSAWERVNKR